ncbi:fluoride efflux transporter CrcB [Roseivirga sp. BDSF3-8]|uniref:fluoride efflux transporter CrcB n=1 Tax=Roseivirga sp. BDSF3-8 TaxID=3241598 RepID=UPI00353203E0
MAWQQIIIIGLGGFLGSISRHLCTIWLSRWTQSVYPWGTFTVNMLGCLLLGFLIGLAGSQFLSERWRLFLAVGFCGSFTTFSTFSAEGFGLFEKDLSMLGLLYLAGSVAGGLLLAGAGLWLGRQLNA